MTLQSKPIEPAPAFSAPAPHTVSVVVPMYNEADNGVALIDAVQAALHDAPFGWELIVVDDGSRDGTPLALRQRAREVGAHIRIIGLRRNFKQTAAMQAGIDAALGDVIVTMDGDLQNDPADIPAMVAHLIDNDLDLVAGWRRHRQDGLWLRKIPSRIANHLIRKITALPFQDLGCSLKAYRASVLKEVRLLGEMHRFIPAWMAMVTSPHRMSEVPVNHRARTAGESKYGLSRTFRVIIDVLTVHFFLKYGSRPGHFFGGIGLSVMTVGLLILAYLGGVKLMGEDIGGRPLLWVGFVCVLSAVQFLTVGILAELLIRVYYERPQAHRQYYLDDASPTAERPHWWTRSS